MPTRNTTESAETSASLTARLAEAERTLASIRLARDTVFAQASELTTKLTAMEDRNAELTDEVQLLREESAAAKRAEKASQHEREELRRKCEELRRKILELNDNRIGTIETEAQNSVELTKAREQIAEISAERDELLKKLAAGNADAAAENNAGALEEATAKLAAAESELQQIREEMGRLAVIARQHEEELAIANERRVAMTAELDLLQTELAKSRTEHAAAVETVHQQLQIKEKELAAAQEELQKAKTAHKKKLADLTQSIELANRTRDTAVANVVKIQAEVRALKTDISQQRKQFEEDRVILEARILALESQAGGAPSQAVPGQNGSKLPLVLPPIATGTTQAPLPAPGITQAPEPTERSKSGRFGSREALDLYAKVSTELELLLKDHGDSEALDRMDAALRLLQEQARQEEMLALHHGALACAGVTSWLKKNVQKAAAILPLLAESAPVLRELAKLEEGVREVADPTGATVYAVDDDPDNCECIAAALEKLELHARYSAKPDLALAQLQAAPVDLIVLDVDMPGMDGFQLYRLLRENDFHRLTPILFVSALISTKDRLAELPHGNHAFLAKPYNLAVLGAKAMTMILGSRLLGVGADATNAGSAPRKRK